MIRVIKASLLHNIFNNVCHVVYHVTTRKTVYILTLYTNSRDSSSVFAGRNFAFHFKQSFIFNSVCNVVYHVTAREFTLLHFILIHVTPAVFCR